MTQKRQTKGGKALWYPIWIDQYFGDGCLDDMTPDERDLYHHLWTAAWGSSWPGVIGKLGRPWSPERIATKCRRGTSGTAQLEPAYTALCTLGKLEELLGGYVRIPSVVKRLPRYLRNIYTETLKKHTAQYAPEGTDTCVPLQHGRKSEEVRGTKRKSEEVRGTTGPAPKVLSVAASAAGVDLMTLERERKRGYQDIQCLSWCLFIKVNNGNVKNPNGYLTKMLRQALSPPEDFVTEAGALLKVVDDLGAADNLKSPARAQSLAERKAAALTALRESEGAG